MEKWLEVLAVVVTGLIIFIFITLTPLFFDSEYKYTMNDEALRQKAFSTNITPLPSSYEYKDAEELQKILLGKKLFNDPLLSKDKTISCASCHKLEEGGDDNLPTAIGYAQQKNPFHLNTPTVLNTSDAVAYFWNARAKSLEEQAAGPIQAHFEMNMSKDEVVSRLQNDKEYAVLFKTLYPNETLNFDQVVSAIATYERTLITRGKIDDFLAGDNNAISAEAKKGFELFLVQGCKGCHAGRNFGGLGLRKFPLKRWWDEWLNIKMVQSSNQSFPTFKLVDQSFPFENIGGFKGKDNNQIFRVPILRNINNTAPYFHNGSIKELKEAVRIMGKYQLGVIFTKEEINNLVEFLKTLSGKNIDMEMKKKQILTEDKKL